MKARDWLVSQGLAKQGRGRFSREAKAALVQAIANGTTFSDFKTDDSETSATPKVSRVQFKAVAPKPDRKPTRTNTVMWGVDNGNSPSHSPVVIALSSCGSCSRGVAYCSCNDGPRLPRWLGGGAALLEKPCLL